MSPTTWTPVFRISAVTAVTCLDSDPVGCTTLAASLSFISCSGLRRESGELIIFSTLGSTFDPSRYDTVQDPINSIEGALPQTNRPAADCSILMSLSTSGFPFTCQIAPVIDTLAFTIFNRFYRASPPWASTASCSRSFIYLSVNFGEAPTEFTTKSPLATIAPASWYPTRSPAIQ